MKLIMDMADVSRMKLSDFNSLFEVLGIYDLFEKFANKGGAGVFTEICAKKGSKSLSESRELFIRVPFFKFADSFFGSEGAEAISPRKKGANMK